MAIYNNDIDPNVLMWEQLEAERIATMSDPNFQKWVQELNVSQSYEDRTCIINANELNKQYNTTKYSNLNFNID